MSVAWRSVGLAMSITLIASACSTSSESDVTQASRPPTSTVTVTVTETVAADPESSDTPTPGEDSTTPDPAVSSTADPTPEAPREPEVQFAHGGESKRAKLGLPTFELPRGTSAVIDVTGFRTYHVEVPTPLYGDHIRCKTRGADNDSDRLIYQVWTEPGLVDDDYLEDSEYSFEEDGLLLTTQTWSEGEFRRVFSTVYTSAGDERRYIDENQNGMTIDNPKFKYAVSDDRKELRLSIVGVSLDSSGIDPGEVTVNAVLRCR